MANKTGMGLVLAGGAALLLLGTGKKNKKKSSSQNGKKEDKDIELGSRWMELGGGSDEKLKFDAECREIINKLSFEKHNQWLTNRYFDLRKEGIDDPDAITLQLLREQSEQCPWDDQSQWTQLMSDLYGQLRDGVETYMQTL